MTLTKEDSGRTVKLAPGGVVTIRLPENPTTGYRWAIASDGGLEAVSDDFETGGPGLGSGGERIFKFRVPKAGSHQLRLKHWRSFEGDSSITERFHVTVVAK